MDEESKPEPIVVSEEERRALVVLLARLLQAQYEREAAEKAKKEAEARLDSATKTNSIRRSAFGAFGFDTSKAGVWDHVKETMGVPAWNEAFAKARPVGVALGVLPVVPPPPPSAPQTSAEESEAEATTETGADQADEETQGSTESQAEDKDGISTSANSARVRDLALAELETAGLSGLLAAEIRRRVEHTLGRPLHYKTIGMTLWRLSKEGHTRREGRTWFFVPPPAEAKNPGAVTPGSQKSFLD